VAKTKKTTTREITQRYYEDLLTTAFSGKPSGERLKKTLYAEIRYLRSRSNEDPLKHTNNDLSQMSFEMAAALFESLLPIITEDNHEAIGICWFAHHVSHVADFNLREAVDQAEQKSIVDGSAGKKEHEVARSLFNDFAKRHPEMSLEELTDAAWPLISTHKYESNATAIQESPKSKTTVRNWAKKHLGIKK